MHLPNFLQVYSICFFQVNWASIWTPRNLVAYTPSMLASLIRMPTSFTHIPRCENYVMSFRAYRDNLLHCNHSWTLVNSSLITVAIFCRFFPVKNVSALSANNIDMQAPDTVDKSLMYIKKSNGPSTDPCGTTKLIFFSFRLVASIWYILFPVRQMIFKPW